MARLHELGTALQYGCHHLKRCCSTIVSDLEHKGIAMNGARVTAVDAGWIMKVNHAGEHGAVNIYAGQIAAARSRAGVLLSEPSSPKNCRDEDCRAAAAIGCAVSEAYVLGLLTGLMGIRLIATTTVAVERLVLRHLQQQLHDIGIADPDAAAAAAIPAILSEEQQHHDQSAARIRHAGVFDRIIGSVISAATEAVIWIGMRI